MDEAQQKQIQQMIDSSVRKAMEYTTRKRGDTPTDENQLVPKKYADNLAYAGSVDTDGTAISPFPTGWSSARPNTGEYVVTHNLGTVNYTVVAGATSNSVYNSGISVAANSFTIIWNSNAAPFDPTNTKFTFIVKPA